MKGLAPTPCLKRQDLSLSIDGGMIEPDVEAAPPEGIANPTFLIGGKDDEQINGISERFW